MCAPDLVALLLDRGEDPAAHDSTGLTALHLAVNRKNLPAVRALLAYGADANARTSAGDTPLALANDNWGCLVPSDTGLPVALELLAHGADVNARDSRGEQLLVRALPNAGIFAALLAHGVDVNARNAKGQTPLIETVMQGHTWGALAFLEHGARVNVRDENGDQPLHLMLRYVSEQRWESRTWKNSDDWTKTSLPEYEKVTARLLANGADVNAADHYDLTPLLYALLNGDAATLDLLLQHGARLDDMTQAFRAAAQDDTPGLAQALTAHPTLPSLRAPDGASLLHVAARWNAAGAVSFLLAQGADPSVRDGQGRTPLDGAGGEAVRRLLIDAGASAMPKGAPPPPSPLMAALAGGGVETASGLLAGGADPNERDSRGDTPLSLAMRLRALQPIQASLPGSVQRQDQTARIVRLLLEKGARPDVAGSDGLSPLWYALLNHDRVSLDALTQHGAHGDRLTSLFQAAASDDVPTLTQGMAADADLVRLRGPSGVTLLHVAALLGQSPRGNVPA